MTSPAGFFRAFFGTCSGRNIFYTLRSHSWGRCLWHLFLLSLITGIIVGHVHSGRIQAKIDAAEVGFVSLFGEEIYTNGKLGSWNWIAPIQAPLKFREMALPDGGRFYYTGSRRTLPDSFKNVTGVIFVWSPLALGVAAPAAEGKFSCVILDTAKGTMERFSGSPFAFEKIFKEAPAELPLSRSAMKKERVSDFFGGISMLMGLFVSFTSVLWHFFLVILYTGIFMLMYRLLNGSTGRLRFLTLKEMWKCGIYAAFPPMVIASIFPVLELPFVTYETVFMIGLLIYWMAVAARLERTPFDEKENCENEK